MKTVDFLGKWTSTYSYQSGEYVHMVIFEQTADGITGKSLPQPDGSQLELNLYYDEENRVLTGTWKEATSPTGAYAGTVFHGALQLLVDETGAAAAGKWIGFNSKHTEVKTGDWSLRKAT